LPIIIINTVNSAPITSKENYTTADIRIIDSHNESYCLETTTEIRGRGNTTWGYPKKPYRIKFFEKQSLFGYQKAKSWVLLANYQDPTLIMNTIAFELGQRFGLPYTNHYVHVELVLNGVYEGSYVLTEQVQVGKGRVDIDEDNGFLVELDVYYDEDPKFRTSRYDLPVMIKSPEDLGDYSFVENAINELETALSSDSFPESGYRDLIDMDTFIDYLLITEIVRNGELGHPKSTYMYKDKNGKISMGPLWDYDWAFGYAGGGHTYFTTADGRIMGHSFFARFFDDPVFRTKYKERWNEKYEDIFSMGEEGNYLDMMAVSLEKSQRENYRVWQWKDAVNYSHEITKMKIWWNDRISYLNEEINKY
jgi:spore coat protein CotH